MTPAVVQTLEEGLKKRDSPDEIVGRIREQNNEKFPCVQTCYSYIYRQRKKGKNFIFNYATTAKAENPKEQVRVEVAKYQDVAIFQSGLRMWRNVSALAILNVI